MDEYEALLMGSVEVKFGTRNVKLNTGSIPDAWDSCQGKQRLYLDEIKEFHREYRWLS